MSLVQESFVQSLLGECDQLAERQEREAKEAVVFKLDQIHELFRKNIRDAFLTYSLDAIIRFAEIAVEIPRRFERAAEMVGLFFERVQTTNQFYIRALLVKAKVLAYSAHSSSEKGEEMLGSLREAMGFVSRALDLIAPVQEVAKGAKDPKGAQGGDGGTKGKYAFLIYNASTTLYKITRFMLRPGWQRAFVDVYQRIYRLLQEVDEPDHNWRCRFAMILYQCLYDAERKPDAYKVLDTLWEKTKNKPCQFQDSLFRLRVYLSKQNNALVAAVKKDTEGADPNGWKVLEALQRMRSGMVPQAQVEKELMTIVNQISLGVLSTSQSTNSTQLSPVMQERLAEAGRIALRFNLPNLAFSIVSFLGKTRQPSQKALVLNQYNKAELLIKKKGDYVDKKTGMSMNAQQIKEVQIENRKQALKIMEKVMLINKKLDNAQLIYEGAILVWNIALPFLSEHYHTFAAKALDLALSLLEQIDSNDHQLRTKFHLQLLNIYFDNDLMFAEVESNVTKALRLDPSLPTAKLPHKPDPEEDPSLYARPYTRYLLDFHQKVLLKNMQVSSPSPLDQVTQDLWTIYDHKSETTKIDTLQKCLKALIAYEEPPFTVSPDLMLVEEEIKRRRLDYDRQKLRSYKRRKLLASEIAHLSFEWDLNDFAKKAAEFVLADNWEVKNAVELIIAQGHCCLYLAQIKIDQLYHLNLEPLFEEEEGEGKDGKEVKEKKGEVLACLKRNLEFALTAQQNYLIFNGAICLWNNFVHIFRVTANDAKLRPDLTPLLKDYFEAMRNALKEMETKGIVYYDLDDKIQAFSNIGLIYARLLESQKQPALVEKVCEDLLLTSLSPNTRKLINAIKARVAGGKAAGAKPADPKKGAPPPAKTPGFNDTFILDISNQLELIQNAPNKADCEAQIVRCFQGLEAWKPSQQDETELELHAELWVKLARLASNEDNPKMLKYALRCAEKALVQSRQGDPATIPSNRLRWYSLAEFLSSEALLKLVNPKTQEAASVEGLLLLALGRGVEAARKGFKCGINILVVDAGKQVWNVSARLQESKAVRAKLVQPLRTVLGFLRELKEDSEPDLLLLLSQLYFRASWESGLYREGEEVADMMLELLPKGLQKTVWEAKMAFMSKQGKNELQAISSIKEAEPSLQAKLWVKLARIAPNSQKQHAAYNKALEILKKEHSVQIVEVLIEYSEWQLRVGKEPVDTVLKNLEYASNILTEIQLDPEDDDGEPFEENMTANSHSKSRSLRSKKSHSKSIKSSQKDIKGKPDKKPTISNRSKLSGASRMGRSGRAAKSIKNNNTKSVFSVREEEANPESLNCVHFQRLFRIYTIMAGIHSQRARRMVFAIKASKYALRMMEKSIKTFNELQDNAAKLNEKEEKAPYRTIALPEAIDDWLTYELPKDYTDKISKVENLNFLGTYTLEKPELTYAYLVRLTDMLAGVGLDYQTVPLRFLTKYITRHILKNEHYHLLEELKLKRVLMINRHPLQQAIKIDFEAIRLTEEQAKEERLRAEYQKATLADNAAFDALPAPNLIQPLSRTSCWFQMGRVLVDFGEVALAKTHLREALECAKILGNNELVGRVHLGLSEIAYLEGEAQEAVQHLLLAHRLCKGAAHWQNVVVLAQKTLLAVRKHEALASLIAKLQLTVSELINESSKEGKERAAFRTELHDLKQLLLAADLAHAYLRFKMVMEENTSDNRAALGTALEGLERSMQDRSSLWSVGNYDLLLGNLQEIVEVFQQRGGNELVDLGSENFGRVFTILEHLDRNIKDFLQGVNLKDSEGGNYNNISEIQIKLGLLRVSVLCHHYQLAVIDNAIQPTEASSQMGNEKVELFMKTLDREIKVRAEPASVKLDQLETALTLLNDLEAHIAQSSLYHPRLLALYAFVQTLRDHTSSEALEAAETFRSRGEEKLEKYESDAECHKYQLKALQAIAEQQIEHIPQDNFEYLAKAQHAASVLSAFRFLSRKLSPNHKFAASQRLLTTIKNREVQQQLIQKERLFNSLIKFPSYQQGIKLMPKNSIYIILKLNNCKTKLYAAVMINEPETFNKKVIAKQKHLSISDLQRIKAMTELLLHTKKTLTKTPIDEEQKLKTLIEQQEIKLREMKAQLEASNQWWLAEVLEYLKTPKNIPQPAGGDKDKKGGKDVKKKGGKDELAGYQSPLPPSPSGIQSVVFFVDEFLYSLPFEELIPADLLPAVSRDSSLFWLSRKLQEINFQPELNNSSGFGVDKGKYLAYDFKATDRNFKTMAAELGKGPEAIKLEGIDSSTRLPSLGDFSRIMGQPGWLSVYGSIDLLNMIRFNSFAEQAGSNKFRLLLVNDNLNLSKSTLNKFKDLGSESLTITIEESEKAYAIIANILNITLVKNRWLIQWTHLEGTIKGIFKALGGGLYVGASNRQNRGEDLSSQWYNYIHGPPIIRL